jgi:hypothetical protein
MGAVSFNRRITEMIGPIIEYDPTSPSGRRLVPIWVPLSGMAGGLLLTALIVRLISGE